MRLKRIVQGIPSPSFCDATRFPKRPWCVGISDLTAQRILYETALRNRKVLIPMHIRRKNRPDSKSPPTQSRHLAHGTLCKTEVSTWLPTASVFFVSISSQTELFSGKTEKKKALCAEALRYTEKTGRKMAARCPIRSVRAMLETCPTSFPNIPSSMRQAGNDSFLHFVSNLWIPRSNLSKWLSAKNHTNGQRHRVYLFSRNKADSPVWPVLPRNRHQTPTHSPKDTKAQWESGA